MVNNSFCSAVKAALEKIEIKKKCCKRAFGDAVKCFGKDSELGLSANDVLDKVKCDSCIREFLRASFICRGNVTDPEKRNHLDFAFADADECDAVERALELCGFIPGKTERRGKQVLYFKSNDTVSDFLAFIGATKAAFDVMNSKIVKEVRNNANRLVNCDTANIEKAISASQKYIDAVNFIKEHGSLEALPGEL